MRRPFVPGELFLLTKSLERADDEPEIDRLTEKADRAFILMLQHLLNLPEGAALREAFQGLRSHDPEFLDFAPSIL